jgi:hypothetical protein
MEDIYMLVGTEDIRRARDTARENIETLIDKVNDDASLEKGGRT